MQAFDTNVVVRLVLGDDPEQAALAAQHWRDALEQGGVYLSQIVLVELVWVLGFSVKLGRERIVAELRRLLALQGVVVEDVSNVIQAIACYEASSVDFADCLILESARKANALPVQTFDRRFARQADVKLIVGTRKSHE